MPVPAEVVPLATVRPLRHEVLRPGQSEAASEYPYDDDPLAVHVAVREGPGGAPVAVGSLLPEDPPGWLRSWPGVPALPASGRSGPGPRWWRVRGMATATGHRGRGHGRAVLDELLERAEAAGGGALWCNARVGALSLYRRAGFHEAGERFELAGLGPHLTMWRELCQPGRPADKEHAHA
jgi:GNAT superfamily N-acetyltransferase